MTSPLAPIFESPNTRKKKRDYAALNKHGLFGGDIPLPPPRKKKAVLSTSKSPTPTISSSPTTASGVSRSLSNLDTDITLRNQCLRWNTRLRVSKSSRKMSPG